MARDTVFRKATGVLFLLLFVFSQTEARQAKNEAAGMKAFPVTAAAVPNLQQCTHRVGRLWFTVTNYGILGNQGSPNGLRDCITGGTSSSAEFPGGSRIEYLFQGALWVGGIVEGDTLVSTGDDGWVGIREIFPPPSGAPDGDIVKRSTNPASPFFSPDAVSDLDMIATMLDTLTDSAFVKNDPAEGRPHKPMGLKIVQTSLSFTGQFLEDLILVYYKLENIGQNPIQDAYIGLFFDNDAGHPATIDYYFDDLAGLFQADPQVAGHPLHLEIPYIADNDGDNSGSLFRPTSPTAAAGLLFFGASQPAAGTSFNWWTPNGDVPLDWGPQLAPGRRNRSGGLGQPEGDALKYYYMSNGEKDYLQVSAATNHSPEGWLPPLSPSISAVDIANGYDTRYLYSVGPFQLAPAETTSFFATVLMGDKLHKDPRNFLNNLGVIQTRYLDTSKVNAYQRGLDFSDLTSKALAAMQKTGFIHPVRGDVNGDSLLTSADAVQLINAAFLGDPLPVLFFHDMNCDRIVTAADVVLLLNRIFMGVPLPC
jgi:hypothetical protein